MKKIGKERLKYKNALAHSRTHSFTYLVHIFAVKPHFRELGRFDFDEGRLGQLRDAPRNLSLAATGGSDHQYVLWDHLGLQIVAQLVSAPSVSQGNGDGSLRVLLPDDELVQLIDHFARLECGHGDGGGRWRRRGRLSLSYRDGYWRERGRRGKEGIAAAKNQRKASDRKHQNSSEDK